MFWFVYVIYVALLLIIMTGKNYSTPILIFTYKRLKSLKRLIKSLKFNKDYNKHKLYILSDGSKKKIGSSTNK